MKKLLLILMVFASTAVCAQQNERILLIGDSMTGLLCYPMSRYAEENGHSLTCISWTSSTTRWWAQSKRLASLIASTRPTYVIICLGSNELTYRNLTAMKKNIQIILQTIGNIPTVWIGPPNWCEDGGINNLLLDIMGEGSFFLSKDLVLERRGDGKHPTLKAADKWMDAFASWMNQGNAVHPILLNIPQDKKGTLDLTIINPRGRVVLTKKN